MDITCLELCSPANGVGYLEVKIAGDLPIEKLLRGLRPVSADWQSLLLDLKSKGEAVFMPRGFSGWTFEDEGPARFLIFYQTLEHLAAALSRGQLTPVGGADRLKAFGLTNARGVVTPSHLRKSRRLLGAMGVQSMSRIAGARRLTMEQKPGGPLRLFQHMTVEAWEGKLVAIFLPAMTRRQDGVILSTAQWLASPSQVSRLGRVIRRPMLYFDGKRLHRLMDVSMLPAAIREDFEKSGEVVLVDRATLCPPLLFHPIHVIPGMARWKASRDAQTEPGNECPHPVPQTEAFLVPVFSVPNAPQDVPLLDEQKAGAALRHCTDYPPREKMTSLPHGYRTSCDFYLCQRRYPGLLGSPFPAREKEYASA